MEMTTMTLKVQYLTKLEEGTQIPAGWYVTTPLCPGVVFATEQEALAYGRRGSVHHQVGVQKSYGRRHCGTSRDHAGERGGEHSQIAKFATRETRAAVE